MGRRFKLAFPFCQACQAYGRNCANFTIDIHHVCGRVGDLLNDTRFWMAVCRVCHTEIHSNVPSAKALGLLRLAPHDRTMRQPDPFLAAMRIYHRGLRKGAVIGANPKPDFNAFGLSEWEAKHLEKRAEQEVAAELKKGGSSGKLS